MNNAKLFIRLAPWLFTIGAVPDLGNHLPRLQDPGILPAAADRRVQSQRRLLAGDPAQFLDHARIHDGGLSAWRWASGWRSAW